MNDHATHANMSAGTLAEVLEELALSGASALLSEWDRESGPASCQVGEPPWLIDAWVRCLQMVGNRGMPADFVRFIRDGVDGEDFVANDMAGGRPVAVVDPAQFELLLGQQGFTFSVVGVERMLPEVAWAMERLGRVLGGGCDMNFYCTPSGGAGLGAHCDPQDVMIVQLRGAKRWQLWHPERPLMTPAEYFDAPCEFVEAAVAATVEVRPGDMLYLPRGWGHAAMAVESTSVHATIGLTPVTLDEVLERVGQPRDRALGRRAWVLAGASECVQERLEMLASAGAELIERAANRGSSVTVVS